MKHYARATKQPYGPYLWYAGYSNLIKYSLQYDKRKVKNLEELDNRIADLSDEIDGNLKTVQAIDEALAERLISDDPTVIQVIREGKERLLSRRETIQSERLMVQQARDEWILMIKAREAEKAYLTRSKA